MINYLINNFQKLHEKIVPKRTKEDLIEIFASSFIRDMNDPEYKFTLEDKTDIIALVQKKQFQVLETKASEIEEIQNEMDKLTILSTND